MSSLADISTESYKVELKPSGVAIVRMDLANSPVNLIGDTFMNELPPVVRALEANSSVKSIVFISAKKGNFIAGADIQAFTDKAKEGKDAVKEISAQLQAFLNELEGGKPKVAAIDGSCLGGGAEFALACHYRVASESPGTVMGFPEVMLGILPGGGGTNRLPKLIGVQNALPFLLQGAQKKAKQAKSSKIVDATCDVNQLETAAVMAAEGLAAGTLKVKRGEFKGMYKMIEDAIVNYSFARDYVFKTATQQVMKASGGLYPAPLKILEIVKKNAGGKKFCTTAGYDLEADGFADLALTPESAGLKAVFFGQTALKKNPFKNPKPVKQIGVLGAGLMGAGIAEVSINKGLIVALKDLNPKGLQVGEKNIAASFDKKVKKKKMSVFDANVTKSRLIGLTNEDAFWPKHFKNCDVVIEAVFEDLGVKHKVVTEMEANCREDVIIATNTSSLPVASIASVAKRPENIVGMHYFSPVTAMQLLEVIPHEGTSDEVTATAVQLGLKQGKLPIVVKDVPGFFVNRCLGPYIDESMVLAMEVENYLQLDKAIKAFGFPIGPMALADEVGVEVAFHLHENLRSDLQERMSGANIAGMEAIKGAGIKGKRFGSGFLSYPGKAPGGITGMFAAKQSIKPNPVAVNAMKPFMKPAKYDDEEIQARISARFVNEAAFCLQDGVIRNAVDGDMASIFGVGFPPFTGGPFRYMDRVGIQKYVDNLNRLADKYGPRFKPAPILVDMAASGKKFY